jgi:hypothetical protein
VNQRRNILIDLQLSALREHLGGARAQIESFGSWRCWRRLGSSQRKQALDQMTALLNRRLDVAAETSPLCRVRLIEQRREFTLRSIEPWHYQRSEIGEQTGMFDCCSFDSMQPAIGLGQIRLGYLEQTAESLQLVLLGGLRLNLPVPSGPLRVTSPRPPQAPPAPGGGQKSEAQRQKRGLLSQQNPRADWGPQGGDHLQASPTSQTFAHATSTELQAQYRPRWEKVKSELSRGSSRPSG